MKTVEQIMGLADSWMYARLNDVHTWSGVEIARDTLRTAIAELAADAARMDALDMLAGSNLKTDIHTGLSITTSIYHRTGIGSHVKKQAHGRTFREAVDVFIKEPT